MPGRNKNKELIKEIKEGNEDILLYLFRKYYADMKRVYRSHGIREKEIPAMAASCIVKVWMEIHRNDFSENIDLSSYLLNTVKENAGKFVADRKAAKKNKSRKEKLKETAEEIKTPQEIIAECVNVLDGGSRKALQWRYAENYSIDELSQKLKTDASATHSFINKAFEQLASIVKIRMENVDKVKLN